MPLYKRDGKWQARYRDLSGKWVRKTTGHTDKKLAQARLLKFQQYVEDPDAESQDKATLRDACDMLIADRKSKGCAADTLTFYAQKCGTLIDIVGADTSLSRISAPTIDRYIHQRRKDGVAENTISKELGTWRSAMQLAKRARIWTGDMSVFPIGFAPEYQPRTRYLTPAEVHDYAAVMDADKFAIMAFSIATSAEWSALWRAVPEDIADDFTTCRVRGSKNINRDRVIPILLPACRRLLEVAKKHAKGTDGTMFQMRATFREDLNDATSVLYPCGCHKRSCKRCLEVRLSPNDLRRTHAKWLKLAGLANDDIGPLLGHQDGRMISRVYGRMTPMQMEPQLRKQLEERT